MQHPSPPRPANQTTGATRAEGRGRSTRRGKRSAHANGGRTTAETAGTHGRAPRAQPTATNGSRARERGPLPPLKFPAGCDPEGEHEGGKGGAPRGRGGGRGTRPRETERSAPPHRQPNAGTAANDSARRRAAGAKQDGKPDDSPPRGRKTERGQRPSRPGRRRRDGQRARKPPPPRPTPQHGANHASGRRHGGETDGDGAGRAAETGRESQAAAPPPAQKKSRDRTPQHARDRRGGRFPRRPRAAARTHAGRGRVARTRRRPASRERNGPTPGRRAGARKPGQGRRGQRQERRRAHRPAKRRERRERREPPARSWPAAAATLGRDGRRETSPSAFPLPSLVRFSGHGWSDCTSRRKKSAQKGEKTRIWGLTRVEQCAILGAWRVEHAPEGVENMETTKRKWSIQTAHTRSIGARLPNDLYERLKTFCAQHGYTTTEAVCDSLERFMNDFEDDGKEDGGYFVLLTTE